MKPTTLAAIVFGSLMASSACSKPAVERVETTAPVPVIVEPSRIDTLTATISASGVVAPAPGADWTIVAPGPARILELPKAENDVVRQGDVLVRFAMPGLTAELNAKRAEVVQATNRVKTATSQLKRQTDLLTQGVAAQRDVDAAQNDLADAQSALQQAQSAADADQELSDRLVVRARFDGVVVKRWHNPGEMVDAAAADPILRVLDPRKLQVVASVPMAALGRIIVGRSAKIIGPAGGDGDDGTVLTKPSQVEPGSATADVRLAFAKPTDLPAGAVVQVEILAEVHANIMVVRTAAIVSEEDEIFVMVAGDDKRAHKYPVVLGFATHDMTEIKNGLTAGLSVIVRGQDGLPDGGTIVVQK
jgi:RND family efflux transporter MFP subunit